MTNAFAAKPKVADFVANLQRNRTRALNAGKTAQRHNIPQDAGLRNFTPAERQGKENRHE